MFSNAGKATHPALTATAKGESIDKPMRAQASFANKSAISCHKAFNKLKIDDKLLYMKK